MRARAGYRHAGLALIRATTYPGGPTPPEGFDPHGPEAKDQARTWLARAWAGEMREAVRLASPALADALDGAVRKDPGPRQTRRLALSLTSYLLRWQHRPTPFGLFAGVAAAQIGGAPVAKWGDGHQVVVRADTAWVNAVTDRLEQIPAVLNRLPVVAHHGTVRRGDRLVIPGLAPDDAPAKLGALEVTIGLTRPVRAALDAASRPIRFSELVDQITAGFPEVPADRVRELLTGLIACRALITALRAPMTAPDPLQHLVAALHTTGASQAAEVGEHAAGLQTVHARLSAPAASAAADTGTPWALTADTMSALGGTPGCIVDVRLDCAVTLPGPIMREAEDAASTLLRLTTYPYGHPHWKAYHAAFRNRYGTGAIVPVLDLVADSGLGLPAGFLGSGRDRPAPALTTRDQALLSLVQQATIDRRDEIALASPEIDALTVGDPDEAAPPPWAELAFEVHAPCRDALSDGRFRLLVTGTPRTSSSMAGRFAHLLDGPDRDRLTDAYATAEPDSIVLPVQLSFPARRAHSENVARVPQMLPHVISLSEHRNDGDTIALTDLAVTADSRHMHLVQRSTSLPLRPRVLHALEAGTLTPPLARFLAEVTTARYAFYGPFDWGAAAGLPYLPRVRYGRAVLRPARWLLSATELPGRRAGWPEWQTGLQRWRERLAVPVTVELREGELRLPLDLGQPFGQALLRNRLDRSGRVELQEAAAPHSHGWIGRAHEFLLPLHAAAPGTTGQAVPVRTVAISGHLPGISPWMHAEIAGHPARQDEILTTHLSRLLAEWPSPPLWWYDRYRDMTRHGSDQHLGLYMSLASPERYATAAARTAKWADDLRRDRLVPHVRLCEYQPETGRYGSGRAMDAAQEVFAADSAAAIAQLAAAARSGTPRQALAAASMVDLACAFAATPQEGLRWLVDELPREKGKLDAELRDVALRLADPEGEHTAVRNLPGGDEVVAAWKRRRATLTQYRDTLAAGPDPCTPMRSLLHAHHVRSCGVEPAQERITNRVARAAALGQLNRQEAR